MAETSKPVEVNSPLLHACGNTLYKINVETNSDQVAVIGREQTLTETLAQIDRALGGNTSMRFCPNIASRNQLAGIFPGDRVYVMDASADANVGSNEDGSPRPAMYIFLPTMQWQQIGANAYQDMNDYVDQSKGLKVSTLNKIELASGDGLKLDTDGTVAASPGAGLVIDEQGRLAADVPGLLAEGGHLKTGTEGKAAIDVAALLAAITGNGLEAAEDNKLAVKAGTGLETATDGSLAVKAADFVEPGLLEVSGNKISALCPMFNSKEILTVSGTWIAPVTGWYSATLISGGYGSVVHRNSSTTRCTGIRGCSGVYLFNQLLYLEKGTVVPVTIGAAGKGYRVSPSTSWTWSISLTGPSKTVEGGHTSFGSLTTAKSQTELTADNPDGFRFPAEFHGSDTSFYKPGAGFGASDLSSHSRLARWYGASGGCYVESGSQVPYDGYQGCVILYWFDPAKANGPTEGE